MNKTRAFTLIELLVVISIISMIASIVIATTTATQAKGRDARRMQQIRQIDLATRLYIETKGYAPLAGPGEDCSIKTSGAVTENERDACMFTSSGNNWPSLASELVVGGFIGALPGDPCGSSCSSPSNYSIGYTYLAPRALQYYCQNGGSCSVTDTSYQVYAPLEQSTVLSGNDGGHSIYYPDIESSNGGSGGSGGSGGNGGGQDNTPPSVPQNLAITFSPGWLGGGLGVHITWDASTDSGSGVAGYKLVSEENYYDYDENGDLVPIPPIPGTSRDSFIGLSSAGHLQCAQVRAYDLVGNASALTPEVCSGPTPHPISKPTGTSATSLGGSDVLLTWQQPSIIPDDAENLRYTVYSGLVPVVEVSTTQATVSGVSGSCWTVKARADYPFSDEYSYYFSEASDPICMN